MLAEFLTTTGSSRGEDRAIASRLRRWKSAIPARLPTRPLKIDQCSEACSDPWPVRCGSASHGDGMRAGLSFRSDRMGRTGDRGSGSCRCRRRTGVLRGRRRQFWRHLWQGLGVDGRSRRTGATRTCVSVPFRSCSGPSGEPVIDSTGPGSARRLGLRSGWSRASVGGRERGWS